MLSLQQKYPNIPRKLCRISSCRHGGVKHGGISCRVRLKNVGQFGSLKHEKKVEKISSSTSSSSSSSSVEEEEEEEELIGGGSSKEEEGGKGQFGYLASENGWGVRRMVEEEMEMRRVAQVQAEAFHVPVLLFDHLFFQFFQAEVLAGLLYRLKHSAPDRYACLVAEPSESSRGSNQQLVGVVDVTASRDAAVLQHLLGAKEYLYVSGIAVSNNFRRQKVATALLKACEKLSAQWGFRYLVLRAYEDDTGARTLYTNAGYRVVSGDPPWLTTWIGRKRRILMIKESNQYD